MKPARRRLLTAVVDEGLVLASLASPASAMQGSEVRPASAPGILELPASSLGLIVIAGLVGGLIVLRTFRSRAKATKPADLG